ncbi:MAG: GNAT family N-acetyltransferase [Candidatus Brocadiia bacterium]|jgi:ribosomal protein S18 acetylase RimI-like enzyme
MRRSPRSPKPGASPAEKIVIRQARREDLRECARVLHTRELAGASNWYPTARVLSGCLGKYFLVAEREGGILACSVVEPLKRGVIGWWFAVRKDARGQGVGSALMDELERTAKKDGKYFFLVYSKSGTRAVEFYRKRGYSKGQDFTELIKGL